MKVLSYKLRTAKGEYGSSFESDFRTFYSRAINSAYGGSWSNGHSSYYANDDQSIAAGIAYNDNHNSWENTFYESRAGSLIAYNEAKNGRPAPSRENVNTLIRLINNIGNNIQSINGADLIASSENCPDCNRLSQVEIGWQHLGQMWLDFIGITKFRTANIVISSNGDLQFGTKNLGPGPTGIVDLNDPNNVFVILNYLSFSNLLDIGSGLIDLNDDLHKYYIFDGDPHRKSMDGIWFTRSYDNPNIYWGFNLKFGAPYHKAYKGGELENGMFTLIEFELND